MSKYTNYKYIYGRLIIGFLMVCALLAASGDNKLSAEAGGRGPSGKVLIVSNKNKPEDPVILKIVKMLRKERNYVKLGIGTNLKGVQTDNYGAIIIINFIEDKTKDRSVNIFADKSAQKKIVLLNAVGDYLSPGKGQAGSKTIKADKIAFDIVEKTKIILSNR